MRSLSAENLNLFFKDYHTCSIKGKRINDSINLIRNFISDADKKEKELYLISADQRKAFDSRHDYIFKLIDHMKFVTFMTENIKRLYKKSFAHIEINRMRGENPLSSLYISLKTYITYYYKTYINLK